MLIAFLKLSDVSLLYAQRKGEIIIKTPAKKEEVDLKKQNSDAKIQVSKDNLPKTSQDKAKKKKALHKGNIKDDKIKLIIVYVLLFISFIYLLFTYRRRR